MDARGQSQGVRIALQCSGHLRQLCSTSTQFDPLERLVTECRGVADVCDLFVHTWDTLSAQTGTWHLWQPQAKHESSESCVQMLTRRLRPAAVSIEPQIDYGFGNTTWLGRRGGAPLDTHVSLNGIRSGIRGIARAAAMRQAHEQKAGIAYDIAIRIRPDLYRRTQGGIAWASMRPGRAPCPGRPTENTSWCPINQICSVPSGAWPVIVASQRDEAIKGCDDQMVPGVVRASDMCYWSAPPAVLDQLRARMSATRRCSISARLKDSS